MFKKKQDNESHGKMSYVVGISNNFLRVKI